MFDSTGTGGSMVAEDSLSYPDNPTYSGPGQTVVQPSTVPNPTQIAVKTTQDIIQPTTTPEGQQQTREAYFQKNYDALANVVKEYGLEISPSDTPDYKKIFEPVFENHKTLEYLNSNPNALLDLTEKYFPGRIVRPTFDQEVFDTLTKEFGEDFQPIHEDMYKRDTESYKYRTRMEQIEREIHAREADKIKQQETEALERQNTMRQEFDTQYKQAMTDLNMTDEQIKPYVEKVISGDPKYSNMTNMIKMVMLADGLMEIVPKELGGLDGGIPPSIGSMPGGTSTGKPKSINDYVGM